MTNRSFFIFILTLALTISGCSKEEPIAEKQSGTWRLVKFERLASDSTTQVVLEVAKEGYLGEFLLLNDNGDLIPDIAPKYTGHSGYYQPIDTSFTLNFLNLIVRPKYNWSDRVYFLWKTDLVVSNRLAFFQSETMGLTIEHISENKQRWHYQIGETAGRYIRETFTVERQ